jgi:hypothetical protein
MIKGYFIPFPIGVLCLKYTELHGVGGFEWATTLCENNLYLIRNGKLPLCSTRCLRVVDADGQLVRDTD